MQPWVLLAAATYMPADLYAPVPNPWRFERSSIRSVSNDACRAKPLSMTCSCQRVARVTRAGSLRTS